MRLGILGGTFDPVHFGHLRLAEEIAEELELEKVYLIPAAAPPHKEKKPLTSFQHRLEMVRMAASASPMLEALDMEGRRQGLSYSIETLREFHRIFPDDLKLFFIIGMDAFVEIETWKDYKSLFDYADFVVV
ncbi:MAG: nicotinate (nicotinamide) nucleotide adenylyltransferase, partial [Deltaproteobacteria bacterium]|nr:nicotinate (nicotinamide) nucleotide adenylyltransferase [Deltaproteobacteria bacterium]